MTAPAQPGKTRARSVTQLAKEAMVKDVHMGKRVRKSFAHIEEVLEMPDLIEIQKNSYNHFLKEGLREVLNDVFPITDYAEKLVLEFVDYDISTPPKFTVEECKELDQNYSAPLKVTVRLLNTETGEVKESEVFLGDFPIMTEQGTFVYNGAERVIVSQLMRSPGVYFDVAKDKSGRELSYSHTLLPVSYHGTGDIFSSAVVGGLMRGLGLREAGVIAADFVSRCIEYTSSQPDAPWYGVEFEALLPELSVSFGYGADGAQREFLNGEDVTACIRTPEISRRASDVSAMPAVRAYLLDMQRAMAGQFSVIMDGRDIGTVVLPDADIKIFLTADTRCRAARRYKELAAAGSGMSFEEVLREVTERDERDSRRAAAPLAVAEGARVIDTSELNLEQSIDAVCGVISDRLGANCNG